MKFTPESRRILNRNRWWVERLRNSEWYGVFKRSPLPGKKILIGKALCPNIAVKGALNDMRLEWNLWGEE